MGSLPRIAKPLLRNSLHSADDNRDALTQLKDMLKDAATPAEAEMIRCGTARQRVNFMKPSVPMHIQFMPMAQSARD